ncbi:MAG: diaminopimelate epimerase [Bacteroidetes bacterium]|nr:diaminopimelate epimerase [Bacteroidota bacterium]
MRKVFYKYHGTGNDFIVFDDRENSFSEKNEKLIEKLCHRRFGIGADGILLLRNENNFDFRMIYVNSDGKPSSMCGNGARCISRFASDIGAVKKNEISFIAVDGSHDAVITNLTVKVKMSDVDHIEKNTDHFFLDTGSPHYVKFESNVNNTDVFHEGKKIRNSDRFLNEGTNVNFVEQLPDGIFVRTYERGVEDETLSCGTGVTASALVCAMQSDAPAQGKINVRTPGGQLSVHYKKNNQMFTDVWLEGPAEFVFKGEIEL